MCLWLKKTSGVRGLAPVVFSRLNLAEERTKRGILIFGHLQAKSDRKLRFNNDFQAFFGSKSWIRTRHFSVKKNAYKYDYEGNFVTR